MNRGLANKSIRHFINLLDVDSHSIARQVLSCEKCEVEMAEVNFKQLVSKQLGFEESQNRGLKRLRSVVVDAKVMSLLKETRPKNDEHEVLIGVTGLSTRMVNKRDNQNAIKILLKTVWNAIKTHINMRAGTTPSRTAISGNMD